MTDISTLIATRVMGWEALHVDYFGTEDETPRQRELVAWLAEVGLGSIGDYFIHIESNWWIEQSTWRPDIDWNDTALLMEHFTDAGCAAWVSLDGHTGAQAGCTTQNGRFEASDDSGAVAMCLAALKAYGVDVL